MDTFKASQMKSSIAILKASAVNDENTWSMRQKVGARRGSLCSWCNGDEKAGIAWELFILKLLHVAITVRDVGATDKSGLDRDRAV